MAGLRTATSWSGGTRAGSRLLGGWVELCSVRPQGACQAGTVLGRAASLGRSRCASLELPILFMGDLIVIASRVAEL
jgi:hypothetical protein